jgi:hypothetical protein
VDPLISCIFSCHKRCIHGLKEWYSIVHLRSLLMTCYSTSHSTRLDRSWWGRKKYCGMQSCHRTVRPGARNPEGWSKGSKLEQDDGMCERRESKSLDSSKGLCRYVWLR